MAKGKRRNDHLEENVPSQGIRGHNNFGHSTASHESMADAASKNAFAQANAAYGARRIAKSRGRGR